MRRLALLSLILPLAVADVAFEVVARWPGATAVEVEELVVIPLEEAFSVAELASLEARTVDGETRLRVVLGMDRNFRACLEAGRAALPADVELSAARELPPPAVAFLLEAPARNRSNLSILGRRLRAQLEALPGVGRVEVAGLEDERTLLRFDAERLASYGIGLADCVDVLKQTGAKPRMLPGSPFEVEVEATDGILELVLGAHPEEAVALGDLAALAVVRSSEGRVALAGGERGGLWLAVRPTPEAKPVAVERDASALLREDEERSRLDVGVRVLSGAELVAAEVLGAPPEHLFAALAGLDDPGAVVVQASESEQVHVYGADFAALETHAAGAVLVALRDDTPRPCLTVMAEDPEQLDEAAETLLARLSDLGLRLLRPVGLADAPALRIELDPGRLAALGLSEAEAQEQLRAGGAASLDREQLERFLLVTPDGAGVPLAAVAALRLELERALRLRFQGWPAVHFELAGPPEALEAARGRVEEAPLPLDVEVRWR